MHFFASKIALVQFLYKFCRRYIVLYEHLFCISQFLRFLIISIIIQRILSVCTTAHVQIRREIGICIVTMVTRVIKLLHARARAKIVKTAFLSVGDITLCLVRETF